MYDPLKLFTIASRTCTPITCTILHDFVQDFPFNPTAMESLVATLSQQIYTHHVHKYTPTCMHTLYISAFLQLDLSICKIKNQVSQTFANILMSLLLL